MLFNMLQSINSLWLQSVVLLYSVLAEFIAETMLLNTDAFAILFSMHEVHSCMYEILFSMHSKIHAKSDNFPPTSPGIRLPDKPNCRKVFWCCSSNCLSKRGVEIFSWTRALFRFAFLEYMDCAKQTCLDDNWYVVLSNNPESCLRISYIDILGIGWVIPFGWTRL